MNIEVLKMRSTIDCIWLWMTFRMESSNVCLRYIESYTLCSADSTTLYSVIAECNAITFCITAIAFDISIHQIIALNFKCRLQFTCNSRCNERFSYSFIPIGNLWHSAGFESKLSTQFLSTRHLNYVNVACLSYNLPVKKCVIVN